MKRPVDYITDDEQIGVVANRTQNGSVEYLTIYSGKSRQNKIYVAMNDGSTDQLEDFIQILQQMLKEIKQERSGH